MDSTPSRRSFAYQCKLLGTYCHASTDPREWPSGRQAPRTTVRNSLTTFLSLLHYSRIFLFVFYLSRGLFYVSYLVVGGLLATWSDRRGSISRQPLTFTCCGHKLQEAINLPSVCPFIHFSLGWFVRQFDDVKLTSDGRSVSSFFHSVPSWVGFR